MRTLTIIFATLFSLTAFSQSYTYYITGDTTDVSPQTIPGTCLMGGATEHDDAMVWFLERSGGGNILVIRASGSDGYNDYLYSELGVNVQSVETIVFNSASAANDPFVLERIAKAEAIWIAGGNQWNYVNYWRDSPVGVRLNEHISIKQAPIGGTSAGMAIAGGVYFSAENGTITSQEALDNPYAVDLTLGYDDFLDIPFLGGVVTDTHYDDPDRRGRHLTFLARMNADQGIMSRGIACDEYTAVCIDENGIAHCFGEWPAYDEDIYFLQMNCELSPAGAETCESGMPLNWVRNMAAVKVYRVKGTLAGTNHFDLNDWLSGVGGEWEHWWAEEGQLMTGPGTAPDCVTGLAALDFLDINHGYDSNLGLLSLVDGLGIDIAIYDMLGKQVWSGSYAQPIDLNEWIGEVLLIRFQSEKGVGSSRIVVGL